MSNKIKEIMKSEIIKVPKKSKLKKDVVLGYKDLAKRAIIMVSQTLENSPEGTEEDFYNKLHHSLLVSKFVATLGKDIIKDEKLYIELQIGALLHDMFKFYPVNHGEQAGIIASGLGLSKEVADAVKNHSNKKDDKQSIYTLILMDADHISKLSPEYLLDFIRSGNTKESLETKRRCYTDKGKDYIKVKLKQFDLIHEMVEFEKSLNK